MKYNFITIFALGLIGSVNSAPIEGRSLNAPEKRFGSTTWLSSSIRPKCSTDEDCDGGHYCVTDETVGDGGICSWETREAVMGDEEAGDNKKRFLPHSGSFFYDRPECSTDEDCDGGHYCVTDETISDGGICSWETREAVMGDEEAGDNEKRHPLPEILQEVPKNLQPVGSKSKRFRIPPNFEWPEIQKDECTSDADCEGDHYCVTEYSICSEQTRAEAMANE